MKQRILVAVVGVPVLLALLMAAPDWATAVLVTFLGVVGSHELLTAVCGGEKTKRVYWLSAIMSVAVPWMVYGERIGHVSGAVFHVALAVAVLATFVSAVLTYGGEHAVNFRDICAILVGGVAIPMALTCLLQIRMLEFGTGLVLVPLIAAFCSDTMALFAGMACGKHKLSPKVSPKKTVEGAIGGLLGGIVGMVIFQIVFHQVTGEPLAMVPCILMGLFGAAVGQLGDLSFSLIKREYGIKDYGRLLPGHGGVLDRFDSVIFTAPVVWIILSHVTL